MTTLTKLLPANAQPAQTLLDKAKTLVMTFEQRSSWPEKMVTDHGEVTFAVQEPRALEVGDVFVAENGEFWVVRPAVETILEVSGDIGTMQEAVGALINRGIRVAEADEGFAVLPAPHMSQMLTMVGLTVKEVQKPFDPIRLELLQGGGCGCGGGGCGCGGGHGHDHHHGGGCGCGGHDHDHDHHHGGGCGCGGHDHDHGSCCSSGHDHHHGGGCGCGGHEETHDHGSCCGGGHGHDHHHGGSCGCGGHEEEKTSCCSSHAEPKKEESCGCGCGHK